jgi:hypothetical protein
MPKDHLPWLLDGTKRVVHHDARGSITMLPTGQSDGLCRFIKRIINMGLVKFY